MLNNHIVLIQWLLPFSEIEANSSAPAAPAAASQSHGFPSASYGFPVPWLNGQWIEGPPAWDMETGINPLVIFCYLHRLHTGNLNWPSSLGLLAPQQTETTINVPVTGWTLLGYFELIEHVRSLPQNAITENITFRRKKRKAGYLRLAIEKPWERHSRHWSLPKTKGSGPSEVSFAPDRNFATWRLKWCRCRGRYYQVSRLHLASRSGGLTLSIRPWIFEMMGIIAA